MAKVLVLAQVQDPAKWEAGFRSHVDLFRTMHIRGSMHYAISGNDISVFVETDNLDGYMRVLKSQATADAMASDGVRRETVKPFVLDKELKL